jgi:hypothetical protein
MDVHVPQSITDALRARGVTVFTAQEDGHADAEDADLLVRAMAVNCVLFTRDRDLLQISATWQREGKPFSGLIYAHQLRVTIGCCVNDLALIAQVGEPEDLANRVEFLPL